MQMILNVTELTDTFLVVFLSNSSTVVKIVNDIHWAYTYHVISYAADRRLFVNRVKIFYFSSKQYC